MTATKPLKREKRDYILHDKVARWNALLIHRLTGNAALAAETLGISQRTVQHWVQRHEEAPDLDFELFLKGTKLLEQLATDSMGAAKLALVAAVEKLRLPETNLRQIIGAYDYFIKNALLLQGMPTSRHENVNVSAEALANRLRSMLPQDDQ